LKILFNVSTDTKKRYEYGEQEGNYDGYKASLIQGREFKRCNKLFKKAPVLSF